MATLTPGPRRRLDNREEGGNHRGVQGGQGVSSHLSKSSHFWRSFKSASTPSTCHPTNPKHGGWALGPNHTISSPIGDSHLRRKRFKTKKDCKRSVGQESERERDGQRVDPPAGQASLGWKLQPCGLTYMLMRFDKNIKKGWKWTRTMRMDENR